MVKYHTDYYRVEKLPIFYKTFLTNNDPKSMRDNEIEFIYKERFGESDLSLEEKKEKLYEEEPNWIHCKNNLERDFILANRYREYAPAMARWYGNALFECRVDKKDISNHPALAPKDYSGPLKNAYGIIPKSVWKMCRDEIGFQKRYDYGFIGAWKVDPPSHKVRQWVYDFDRFTDSSYLQFTDSITKKDYKPLGSFDHTLTATTGKVQKELSEITDIKKLEEIDKKYYEIMCATKFAPCPAGDAPWSMRVYEALMCKAIPIVSAKKEMYRTWEEQELGYKFYYVDDEHTYREDWVEHNYDLFMRYHTFYGN